MMKNDVFYNRVSEIRDLYPVRKHREQLAIDIYADTLKPNLKGCELLFERIGLLHNVRDLDRDILEALLADPSSFFEMLRNYRVTTQCARAFVKLGMWQKLDEAARCNIGDALEFWRRFVMRLQLAVWFNCDTDRWCSLRHAPLKYLTRINLYEPAQVSGASTEVAAFVVRLYSLDKNAIQFAPLEEEPDQCWWKIGNLADPMTPYHHDLLIAMAAYAHPSGVWPLVDAPLSGETLSRFRSNYLWKRDHLQAMQTELDTDNASFDKITAFASLDKHILAPTVHTQLRFLRDATRTSFRAIRTLRGRLEVDCGRVFARVWADACATIVAMQQSALGVCGETLPLHVVFDLLELMQDGVLTIVSNEVRLIALIEDRTKRALALHEVALEKERRRLAEDANRLITSENAGATTKRKFDAVSAKEELDFFF